MSNVFEILAEMKAIGLKLVLVGNPNVGKSSVINLLTGSQFFASNYPGTSTEIEKAVLKINQVEFAFYDTLGVYSLYTDREEATLTRTLLEEQNYDLIINIVDASNLERNLVLTYELLERGYPLLVLLNQVDRTRELGIQIDVAELARILQRPVIAFSATNNEGVSEFRQFLEELGKKPDAGREKEFTRQGLPRIVLMEDTSCSGNCGSCSTSRESCSIDLDLQLAEKARKTSQAVSTFKTPAKHSLINDVQFFIDRPYVGTISLLLLAYLALVVLTKFISFSEGPISQLLEPLSNMLHNWILAIMPAGFLTTVLAKAIPEGLVIPFTIIMPAMLMVSLLMAVLEDTGLLPRYSVAMERFGQLFGVSGQAVIPLSLGFGCRTPAVMATRILPNDAQRFIVITLLSIVIPCAATVGVIVMISAKFEASLTVIVLTMLVVMTLLGLLLSRLSPREEAFIYELPPLRVPRRKNVWSKIKLRFAGFFTEVLPLLLVMSIAIRALIESHLLEIFNSMDALTKVIFGIPAEAFVAVLITIFQRYLAPLVLLNLDLSAREATIALSMIALSLPCLPVMVVTVREMGFSSLTKILLMGFITSALVGISLNLILPF
ncbi:MAG TPA: FeoB small GTPase domain-containing protein [Syntrophomonas sp.]|nr:FeoB small GTPase domain-containing protein [Syntrophomonas sp.]HRW11804.1 FeoB small GTPase domain-containing protein [Syntrophomonas sp.]